MTLASYLPYARQEITDADIEAVTAALREPVHHAGPDDRALRGGDRRARRREALRRLLERHRRPARRGVRRRRRPRRRGHRLADHVRGLDELRAVPRRDAALRRHRSADVEPRLRRGSRGRHASARRRSSRRASPACPSTSRRWTPSATASSIIEDACHALGGHRDGRWVGGPGGADITLLLAAPRQDDHDRRGRPRDDRGRRARAQAAAVSHARDHEGRRSPRAPTTAPGTTRCRSSASTTGSPTCSARSASASSTRLDGWVARRNEIAARYRERSATRSASRCRPPRRRARCTATTCSSIARARRRRRAPRDVRRAARRRHRRAGALHPASTGCRTTATRLGVAQDGCPHAEALLRRRDLAADVPDADRRRRRARRRRAATSAAVSIQARSLTESARLVRARPRARPGVDADAVEEPDAVGPGRRARVRRARRGRPRVGRRRQPLHRLPDGARARSSSATPTRA